MNGVVVVVITTNKKIFFIGCSFTAHCGFEESNWQKYHWPWLVSQKFNCFFHNAAIGGFNNDEIFYRTIENLSNHNFDLAIVQWSAIGRKTVYFDQNNVDDFSIINNGIVEGKVNNKEILETYGQIHYSYLNNQFVNLKQWLLQILALENFCKIKNKPVIFIKGFENYLSDFIKCTYDHGFHNIEDIKSMLDFDNRPDDYILEKINTIKNLINKIDSTLWVNFDSPAFYSHEYTKDLADDNEHPGKITNLQLYNDIVHHCETRRIFG